MTAVNASTPPIQQPVAPQPAAPAQVGPRGAPAPIEPWKAPPKTLSPAPLESKQTLQMPLEERAKAAVDAFHAVRAELRALVDAKRPAPAWRIDAKQKQLDIVQSKAVEAATVNLDQQKGAADILEKQLANAKSNVELATMEYAISTPADGEKWRLRMTDAGQAVVLFENAAMRARQNLAVANSLLEQANGTPKGNLDAAHDNLTIARERYAAAEMKLEGASDKTTIGVEKKELNGAAKQLAAAKRDSRLAEKAVTDANSQPAP